MCVVVHKNPQEFFKRGMGILEKPLSELKSRTEEMGN